MPIKFSLTSYYCDSSDIIGEYKKISMSMAWLDTPLAAEWIRVLGKFGYEIDDSWKKRIAKEGVSSFTPEIGTMIGEDNDLISHLALLQLGYSPDLYSTEKSAEVLEGILEKLSVKFGDTLLPVVYTTQLFPSRMHYTTSTWREIYSMRGFIDSPDFGRINIVRGFQELKRKKRATIVFFDFLSVTGDYLVMKLSVQYRPRNASLVTVNRDKLLFDCQSGDFAFAAGSGKVRVGDKGHALMSVLSENKNTPFTVQDIIKYCNRKVNKVKNQFRDHKDISDTVRYLRRKLKLRKSAIFPIRNTQKDTGEFVWQWYEK